MQKVDVEKIMALRKAGWGSDRIAADMHIEPDIVNRITAEYSERENNNTGTDQEEEKRAGTAIILLTSDKLKEIYENVAVIGAKEALKTFEQERKKEQGKRADRRLRNTRLLLRNYHMLKEHADRSVFGRTQMEESALDILESMMSLYDNNVIIESIKRSATRTAVIVSHIDTMFGLYLAYCNNAVNRDIEMRRYEVVWDMYMADKTLPVKEIAEKQNISARSVYEDIKAATEKLSALIFGVDGLNVH